MLLRARHTESPNVHAVFIIYAYVGGNHLRTPFGDLRARQLQPWCLREDDEVCALHADAIDAIADMLANASHT